MLQYVDIIAARAPAFGARPSVPFLAIALAGKPTMLYDLVNAVDELPLLA